MIAPPAAPPRSRRRAGVVFASTIGNMLSVTPTVTAVFGVFLVAIAGEFHWPRAEVGGALGLLSVTNALASPLAGRLADLFGTRRVILWGSGALALAIISLAFAPANSVFFYMQFAAIGAIGAMPSSMVFAKLLAEWFDEGRGFWIGVAGGVGNGVGATVLPILAGLLFVRFGWRAAFAGIGLLVLVLGVPILFAFIRDPARPAASSPGVPDPGENEYEGEAVGAALRSVNFWILALSMPVGAGCLIALFSSLIPLLMDNGLSLSGATTVLVAFALTCTVWEPTVGFLLDRTRRPAILCAFYLAAAGGLLLLINTNALPSLIVAGILLGIGLGAETSALSFLLSRYFGRRSLGTVSGVAFAVLLGVGALALVLLNAVYDHYGSYRIGVEAMLPLLVWNGIAMLLLGRYRFGGAHDAPKLA